MQTLAYMGLGSNLDDPMQQVADALEELSKVPHCRLVDHSPWYRSTAVGPGEQSDYVNGVARLETSQEPHALLDALQAIELAHGRHRIVHWGPRTLDLDLLLFGDQIIDTERLKVPHPFLADRNFVLYPLHDIDSDIKLPSGVTIASLLANCSAEELVRITDE